MRMIVTIKIVSVFLKNQTQVSEKNNATFKQYGKSVSFLSNWPSLLSSIHSTFQLSFYVKLLFFSNAQWQKT